MSSGVVVWPPGTAVLDIVSALGPLAVLVSLAVTVRQRSGADKRSEFWRRAQWAMDHAMSGDEEKSAVGWALLIELTDSKLADKNDAALFQQFAEARLDVVQQSGETGSAFVVNEGKDETDG